MMRVHGTVCRQSGYVVATTPIGRTSTSNDHVLSISCPLDVGYMACSLRFEVIIRARKYSQLIQSGDNDYLNETRRKPTTWTRCPTLFESGTGSLICPVTQSWLDIPRPLFTQAQRHGWTSQGLYLPSHTDTAGHTIYLPSHTDTVGHTIYLPSHTDTAGHTKAFIYPVTQTRLDIPRPLFTQSHRHGWTYHLFTQSHRHGWTYQGLWLPSHTDTAGHTKVFDYPITHTRLDIPRPLITQSHRHGWTYQGL